MVASETYTLDLQLKNSNVIIYELTGTLSGTRGQFGFQPGDQRTVLAGEAKCSFQRVSNGDALSHWDLLFDVSCNTSSAAFDSVVANATAADGKISVLQPGLWENIPYFISPQSVITVPLSFPPSTTLIIVKKVLNADGTSESTNTTAFSFTEPKLSPGGFSLTSGKSQTFSNITPGTYDFTETISSDYATSYSCDQGFSGIASLTPNTLSVIIKNGQTITCTFVNTRKEIIAPPTGSPLPFCGDKIINQPNEQCEVGIACPVAGNICNLQNCTCSPPPPPPISECPKPTVHQFDYGAAHCGDIPVNADKAPHFISDSQFPAVKIGDGVDTEWARNDQGNSGDQDGVEFPQPGVLKLKLFHLTGAGANPANPSTTYLGTVIIGRYQKSSSSHYDFKVLKAEKVRQTVDPIFINYNPDDLVGTGWLTIIYVMADVENYNYSLDQIMAWDGLHPSLMNILFHHDLSDPFDPSIPPGEESGFFYQHDSAGKLTFLKPEEVADPCGTETTPLPPTSTTGGIIPPTPIYSCPKILSVSSCPDGQVLKSIPIEHCDSLNVCVSGGSVLPVPAAQVCGAESTTFFVTEQSFNANLGGLDGASAKCQAAAEAASLPQRTGIKTWKAFLSDDTAKVADLNLPAPYHLLDGTRIAKTKADLFSGKLEAPVNVTEQLRMILDITVAARIWPGNFLSGMIPRTLSGSVLSGSLPPSWIGSVVSGTLRPRLPIITISPRVWTGSTADGSLASDFCKKPSNGSKTVSGMTGIATSTEKSWLGSDNRPCNETASLYCYGAGDFSGIKLPPPPPKPIYICPLMPTMTSCPQGQILKSISLDHCSSYNTCVPNLPQTCSPKIIITLCPEGQVLKKITDEQCGSYNICGSNTVPIAPAIDSLQPNSGPVGTSVTVTGNGFTPTGNRVKFGNLGVEDWSKYNLSSTDGKTLSFSVPAGNYMSCWNTVPACGAPSIGTAPGVYSVSVINANGVSNVVTFTVTTSGIDAKNFPFRIECGPLRTDTNTAICTLQAPREIIGGTLNLRLSNAKILDTKRADGASPTMLVQLSTQTDNVSTTIHAEFKELLGKATTVNTTYPLLQLTVQADPNTFPINIMAALLKDSLVFLQP